MDSEEQPQTEDYNIKPPLGTIDRMRWLRLRIDECNRTIQDCDRYDRELFLNPTAFHNDVNRSEVFKNAMAEWEYATKLYREGEVNDDNKGYLDVLSNVKSTYLIILTVMFAILLLQLLEMVTLK